MEEALHEVEKRSIFAPERLLLLAKAHFYLNELKKADNYIRTILTKQPACKEAVELKEAIKRSKKP